MKAFLYSAFFLALPTLGLAQTATTDKPTALITAGSEQTKVDGPNITFNVEANPVNNTLRVRTNAKGPMQLEVNDSDGRPVLTKALSATGAAMSVPLGNLPNGSYVVRCSVADKTFMRRVTLGQ
ncbi:T9SS type A sorting domain-containing protein [Hymenobacter jeollabukensis]|uniref:T9SS type A sorting domain-containing protein n=1 Tax=Hymenobacter jeollabukensis TaxID=2025313 RepID=A0A5R8WTV5_9BACT|nr:T9SS type A sorting domain-containing protein [Hymenobacter jeollabukensis]TLM95187.1 T9SS type A sorting domain-containing protein [Hymenobacter jeollabukensis]